MTFAKLLTGVDGGDLQMAAHSEAGISIFKVRQVFDSLLNTEPEFTVFQLG